MKIFPLLFSLLLTFELFSQPVLDLQEFAGGFTKPLGLIDAGDDRVFVICQDGYMRIVAPDGTVNPVPYLDINARVASTYNAHGLLGAVFHPDYAVNGYFYVNYINNDQNSVISRFSVDPSNPDLADTTSEEILLIVEQPYRVHKAGDMHFGPDGYLYFPLGDGGTIIGDTIGDPDNRAQDPQTYLGKMLRVDVDGALPYEIPATNPFYGAVDTLNEIWATGLRNPWRFSFDQLTGDMWLPDVGHNLWEEINFEPAGFTGGNNYGWRCYESNAEYNFDSCDGGVDYTYPLFEYPHNDSTGGYSVTGGYVYRGATFPGMQGIYFCCDYVTGNFYTYQYDDAIGWISNIYPSLLLGVVSFGEDNAGELYCVAHETGVIYKIIDLCPSVTLTETIIHADCEEAMNGSINLMVDGAIEPYTIYWSTGDSTLLIDSLMNGSYLVTITDSLGCITNGTYDVLLNPEPVIIITLEADGFYAVEGESYQWYYNGEMIDGATEAYYYSELGGLYSVAVTFESGCTFFSESFDWIFVGMESFETHQEIIISPNPVENFIQIETAYGFTNYAIYNFSGQLIQSGQLKDKLINSAHLPGGVYRLLLLSEESYQSGNFVKL